MPCFSRDALKAVLPTFEQKIRWCGIEMHWPVLVGSNHKDMAIVDAVSAKHTRPVQSWNSLSQLQQENYLKKHNLSWSIEMYGGLPLDNVDFEGKQVFDELRTYCEKIKQDLYHGGLLKMKKSEVNSVIFFLKLNSILWNDHASWDVASRLAYKLNVETVLS